jgi:hypothetical protein
MSYLPTPPATPTSSPEGTPPPDNRNLPILPSPTATRKEESRLCKIIAEYYWIPHFEFNSADPASFIDKLMTDYADDENDVVGEWLEDMKMPYKLYRVCLNYGAARGSPEKALEAKTFQGV